MGRREEVVCATCGARKTVQRHQLFSVIHRGEKKRFLFCDMLCYRWYPVKTTANYADPFGQQVFRCGLAVSPRLNVGTFKPLRLKYGFNTNTLGDLASGRLKHPFQRTLDRVFKMIREVLGEEPKWQGKTHEEAMVGNPGLTELAKYRTPRRLSAAGRKSWKKLSPKQQAEQVRRINAARWTDKTRHEASLRARTRKLGKRDRFKSWMLSILTRETKRLGRALTAAEKNAWIRDQAARWSIPEVWVRDVITPHRGQPRKVDWYLIIMKYPHDFDRAVNEIATLEGMQFKTDLKRVIFKENLRIGFLQTLRRDGGRRLTKVFREAL